MRRTISIVLLPNLVRVLSHLSSVGEETSQPRKDIMNGGDHEGSTVAVLHVGRMQFGSDQKAGCVGNDIPLAAIDFLSPRRNRGSPASVVLTDCLSITPADELGLRQALRALAATARN
jgi:hypothetical protein